MRKLIGIVILMVSGVAWCGDAKTEKVLEKNRTLQKDVKKVLTKIRKEDTKLEEAKKKHKEAIAKLKKDLVVVYELAMKKYTKKGDIRTATAVMKLVDEIKRKTEAKPEKNTTLAESSGVTSSTDTGHSSQVWQYLGNGDGTFVLSAQHAESGVAGAFFLIAYADTNKDGIPDSLVAKSKNLTGNRDEWGSFKFKSKHKTIFVGMCWKQSGELIYYSGGKPQIHVGLGDVLFISKSFSGRPSTRVGNRYGNIKLNKPN